MSEAEYDAEIAPLLMAAAKRCEELGCPMVAVVEYEPGLRGETRVLPSTAGLPMFMLAMVAHHGQNIDGLLINLVRHCKREGIDMSGSMFLRRFAGEPAEPTQKELM